MQEARSQLLTSIDACVQLGQQKGELESQLGLMEHQARSLNQDKEHLEEELHDKQARLDQAAAAAQQAEARVAQEAQTALHRCDTASSVLVLVLMAKQVSCDDGSCAPRPTASPLRMTLS